MGNHFQVLGHQGAGNTGKKRGYRKRVGYTSTGSKADVGTIAADPRSIPYGTKLYIQGYGFGVVEDTGGALKGILP